MKTFHLQDTSGRVWWRVRDRVLEAGADYGDHGADVYDGGNLLQRPVDGDRYHGSHLRCFVDGDHPFVAVHQVDEGE